LLSPGLLCPGMKYTTADKILASLENMEDRVTVSPEIRERAAASLQRMLELSSTE
ncbi:MAG: quinolinate synthase NadA, partial [Firmicutes bacterium]|nr:quinolinate synthase NadA [Bacillota bacterium]